MILLCLLSFHGPITYECVWVNKSHVWVITESKFWFYISVIVHMMDYP